MPKNPIKSILFGVYDNGMDENGLLSALEASDRRKKKGKREEGGRGRKKGREKEGEN